MRSLFVLLLFITTSLSAQKKPNVLIIMADDCTYNDLPLYGGKNANTPHLDQLASQGLTFNEAYLSSAMCQPCRAELYSGQYPLHNGCAYNHSASRSTTLSLPHYLKPFGYRVGITGKVHVKPREAFPFEKVGGFDPNCVRNPTRQHTCDGIREFISRETTKPFCLVVALVEPHLPWVMGDPSRYPPQQLNLPPYIADTKLTREYFSRYLAEVTYMDSQVGEILQTLDQTGQRDDTLILFTSEQGSQFPGCKWTNWNTGVHTALIASWPGRVSVGTRTDALVQYADIVPTLIELAGGDPLEHSQLDGKSFKSVLLDRADRHRDYVFQMHNNIPEGPRYPIRSISNGTYRYIRNLTPDELYIEKHLMGNGNNNNPYFATWLGAGPQRRDVYRLLKRYMSRPAEQLYLTRDDPYELNNLAGNPRHAAIQTELRAELERWMQQQRDPGAKVDLVKSHQAAKQGRHLFGLPHK